MNLFTKDDRNAVLFLAIAFMVGFSILYVRDNNRDSTLTLIENNQEISDIVKSAQTLYGKINLNNASEDELIALSGWPSYRRKDDCRKSRAWIIF